MLPELFVSATETTTGALLLKSDIKVESVGILPAVLQFSLVYPMVAYQRFVAENASKLTKALKEGNRKSSFFAAAAQLWNTDKIKTTDSLLSRDIDPTFLLDQRIEAKYPQKDYHRMEVGKINKCLFHKFWNNSRPPMLSGVRHQRANPVPRTTSRLHPTFVFFRGIAKILKSEKTIVVPFLGS